MQTKRAPTSGTSARPQVGAKAQRASIRGATHETKAWKGAVLQIAREGRVVDLLALLADLEAAGDIRREPEESEFDPDDLEKEEALDSEIDLADEDGAPEAELETESNGLPEPAFSTRTGRNENEESPELAVRIELLVRDGECGIHRPVWMRAEPLTENGQEFIDEIGGRFGLLDRVGNWLSEQRKEFLQNPDPWLLGVDALEEMRIGHASVSPGSFLALTKLYNPTTREGVPPELFSRYTTDCFLVWEDGTLPLDFIFGREARMAWVANAVAQLAAWLNTPLTGSLLDRHQHITMPKSSRAKKELMRKEVRALEFGDSIGRANLMAATKWADVLATYRPKLLKATP